MKATELTIVFEDDDGKTHVIHHEGEQAEALFSVLVTQHCYEVPVGPPTGPVLRKATEAIGHVEDYDHLDSPYISDGKTRTVLVDIIPDECRKDCTVYRFRFVCEAVRVEEKKAPTP